MTYQQFQLLRRLEQQVADLLEWKERMTKGGAEPSSIEQPSAPQPLPPRKSGVGRRRSRPYTAVNDAPQVEDMLR